MSLFLLLPPPCSLPHTWVHSSTLFLNIFCQKTWTLVQKQTNKTKQAHLLSKGSSECPKWNQNDWLEPAEPWPHLPESAVGRHLDLGCRAEIVILVTHESRWLAIIDRATWVLSQDRGPQAWSQSIHSWLGRDQGSSNRIPSALVSQLLSLLSNYESQIKPPSGLKEQAKCEKREGIWYGHHRALGLHWGVATAQCSCQNVVINEHLVLPHLIFF